MRIVIPEQVFDIQSNGYKFTIKDGDGKPVCEFDLTKEIQQTTYENNGVIYDDDLNDLSENFTDPIHDYVVSRIDRTREVVDYLRREIWK